MEPFEAPLTKCKCHAAAQTSAVGCNQTSDWQCKHQPRQHEIRQYACLKIFAPTWKIFSAAATAAYSWRLTARRPPWCWPAWGTRWGTSWMPSAQENSATAQLISTILHPLSTKCKPTTRIICCWSLKAKVNNYRNWFPLLKTERFQNLCSLSWTPFLRDSSTRWKMKISSSYLFPDIERHIFETVFLISVWVLVFPDSYSKDLEASIERVGGDTLLTCSLWLSSLSEGGLEEYCQYTLTAPLLSGSLLSRFSLNLFHCRISGIKCCR